MRVVTQKVLGGPEVLEIAQAPRPEPIGTEVLLRVHAAGVNPVDWKTRQHGGFLGEPPFVLGWDVYGVVEALGHGTTRFAVGDGVMGMPWFPRQAGCYGEYVTAPSRHFVKKPASLSHVQAAGLPLDGLTAWQALTDIAHLEKGQRVLINAAAGGVGHLAVQIAKARGAWVAGTASTGKHEFLRSLGVDEPVDYTRVDPGKDLDDLDLVLDMVGGENCARLLPAVKPGGILIVVTGGVPEDVASAAAARNVRTSGILVEPDYAGLEALARLVEDGKLKVHVERTFPLEEVAEAHRQSETRRTTGKIVLLVTDVAT